MASKFREELASIAKDTQLSLGSYIRKRRGESVCIRSLCQASPFLQAVAPYRHDKQMIASAFKQVAEDLAKQGVAFNQRGQSDDIWSKFGMAKFRAMWVHLERWTVSPLTESYLYKRASVEE